jgi:hypothetical protein
MPRLLAPLATRMMGKKRVPCLNEMIRNLRTEYVTVR